MNPPASPPKRINPPAGPARDFNGPSEVDQRMSGKLSPEYLSRMTRGPISNERDVGAQVKKYDRQATEEYERVKGQAMRRFAKRVRTPVRLGGSEGRSKGR